MEPAPDTCNTYRAPSPGTGAGLFASRDLAPGEVVLSIARPLLVIPDSARLKETCSNCFAWLPRSAIGSRGHHLDDVTLKTCTGCRVVGYCSKDCQTQAWKSHHKHECKLFARLHPNVLPTAVRGVIQLLLLQKKGLSGEWWAAFEKLQDHTYDFRRAGGEKWENLILMSKGAQMYSGTDMSEAHVQAMMGRILTNSLTLVTPTFDPIGICVDPLAASINHSCDYNSVVTFDGPCLYVRTLRPLAKDEEVSISYIDCTNPFARRQSDLKDRYFFTCTCAKCKKGTSGKEDAILTPAPDEEDSDSEPDVGPDSALVRATEAAGFSTLESAKHVLDNEELHFRLASGLRLFSGSSSFWPIYRQPWPSIRQQYAIACISTGNWTQALGHMLFIYFYIDPVLFPQSFHPVRVVHNWTLAILILHVAGLSVEQPDQVDELKAFEIDYGKVVWGLLREVEGNMGKSHGEVSAFARMVRGKSNEVRVDMSRGDGKSVGDQDLEPEWKKLRAVAARLA
ncbi:MAG: hypothetical protein M1819_004997 [Sarea resinae]|nr:MAG: hypothetical protein M1819_004997 [Sarea resinae]